MYKIDFTFPQNFKDDREILEYLILNMSQNNPLKSNLSSDIDELIEEYDMYLDLMKKNQIHQCNTYTNLTDDSPVTLNLKYKDFRNLYSNYLSKKEKPGRVIYNYLLSLSDGGLCPYCEISEITSLDHVLPKSSFPQYSIFSQNLVPSCTRCNSMGKLDIISSSELDQIIHPYLDNNIYFNEQWINIKFFDQKGLDADSFAGVDSLIYYVDTPESWLSSQKQKASFNFATFSLGERFSVNAAKELERIKDMYQDRSSLRRTKRLLNNLNDNDILEIIITSRSDTKLSINHWKSILYKALTELFRNEKNNAPKLSFQGDICPRCKDSWNNSPFSCDICSGSGYIGHSTLERFKDNYDYPINCPFCNFGDINCEKCNSTGKIVWIDIPKYINQKW